VCEIHGEILRRSVADLRQQQLMAAASAADGQPALYVFRLSSQMVLDATTRGSIGRFANHSCL
jgi:hypothetical protein